MVRATFKSKTLLTIENDFFSCDLSRKFGGMMRRLSYHGEDTCLIRQGFEFWENKTKHYESEFGKVRSFLPGYDENKNIVVTVISDLVAPDDESVGGLCETLFTFSNNSSKIIILSRGLHLTRKLMDYDNYICFAGNSYLHHSFSHLQGEPIQWRPVLLPEGGKVWWRDIVAGARHVFIKRASGKGLFVLADERTGDSGVYHSKSMFEVKCKLYDGNPSNFIRMEIDVI